MGSQVFKVELMRDMDLCDDLERELSYMNIALVHQPYELNPNRFFLPILITLSRLICGL